MKKIDRLFNSILIFALLVTNNCGKETLIPKNCLIAKVIWTNFKTVSYFYDRGGKIISSALTYTNPVNSFSDELEDYSYDANGNITKAVKSNKNTQGVVKITSYSYDTNNNLVAEVYDYPNRNIEEGWTYEYNPNNQLLSKSYNFIGYHPYSIQTLAYPNTETKNPSRYTAKQWISFSPATPPQFIEVGSGSYEYDGNYNPVHLFPSITNENNVKKYSYIFLGSRDSISYKYEYNALGYPTRQMSSKGDTIEYTYNCK